MEDVSSRSRFVFLLPAACTKELSPPQNDLKRAYTSCVDAGRYSVAPFETLASP